MGSKKHANPLAALGGTFVSPGHDLYPSAYGRFNELTLDPEVADDEERIRVGKRHHGACKPERFFVPAPLRRDYDRHIAKLPSRGSCHCLPGVVSVHEPSTEDSERDGARFVDDGMTIEERIATLLEMRPSMVYVIFDTAVKQDRQTILEALINSAFHLTADTRKKVARQVRHFPSHPFASRLSAALAS